MFTHKKVYSVFLLIHKLYSPPPVSSMTVTPTKLVLGTYKGLIHLFNWPQIISNPPTTLSAAQSDTLLSHHNAVYTVSSITGGGITTDGLTTLTHTFVGRSSDWVSREFLVSVGYGKHPVIMTNKRTADLFKSLMLSSGVCLNVWMI